MTTDKWFDADDPGKAAALLARAMVLFCRCNGMLADNQVRADQGYAPVYDAKAFDSELERMFPGLGQELDRQTCA